MFVRNQTLMLDGASSLNKANIRDMLEDIDIYTLNMNYAKSTIKDLNLLTEILEDPLSNRRLFFQKVILKYTGENNIEKTKALKSLLQALPEFLTSFDHPTYPSSYHIMSMTLRVLKYSRLTSATLGHVKYGDLSSVIIRQLFTFPALIDIGFGDTDIKFLMLALGTLPHKENLEKISSCCIHITNPVIKLLHWFKFCRSISVYFERPERNGYPAFRAALASLTLCNKQKQVSIDIGTYNVYESDMPLLKKLIPSKFNSANQNYQVIENIGNRRVISIAARQNILVCELTGLYLTGAGRIFSNKYCMKDPFNKVVHPLDRVQLVGTLYFDATSTNE